MKLQHYLRITLILLALIPFAASDVSAQDRPIWSGAVSYPNGTVIKTGSGFVPAGAVDLKLPSTVDVGRTADDADSHLFVRILRLADERIAMYEVKVKRLRPERKFEVTLRPVTPTAAEAKHWNVDVTRVDSSFLRNYVAPITVDAGDTLAIEVMANPRTRVKLVDYFLISDHPVPEVENNHDTLAKQARVLALEDMELSVFAFDILRNGKSIHRNEGGVRGRFIWLDIPDAGRFLFSLTPRSEAGGFMKAAYVTMQQISFKHGGDQYELVTNQPIIHASGVYNLWMLHDPTFSEPSPNPFGKNNGFSFGAADDFPGVKRVD